MAKWIIYECCFIYQGRLQRLKVLKLALSLTDLTLQAITKPGHTGRARSGN